VRTTAPPTGGSLSATALRREHGTAVVLDDVTVTIGPRARLGIVGPNGVGKSTLLRILAGVEAPDAGRVVAAPPTLTVGYLPQEPDARPGETLFEALGRRTGVAAADAELQRSAEALGEAAPGADDRYAAALDRWLALGGADFAARAGAVCDDLGLPVDRLEVEVAALSGGQAARAALAAVLLSRFDVLLLDEPTNDLDFAGLERLERFVDEADGALVVVSHDRAFLEHAVDRVLEIDEHSHRATEFGGGYAAYLEARATARRHAEEAHSEFVDERERLKERARRQAAWMDAGVKKQKKRPDDNDKSLRNRRNDRTEKQAAKVRISERAIERLTPVDKPWEGWDLQLTIAAAPRSGDVVARLSGAVVERGSFRLGPLDLEIGWAERVAITGPNGSGKTTLLRTLLGEVPLAAGERWLGPGVVVGELDQRRSQLALDEPLLEGVESQLGLPRQEVRSLLAKFGLGADHVGRPVGRLSPGERTRATLALLMARGVNCLVLDEPTNHLDLPAIEQVEQALDTYDGTLLLVSHDRRLLDAVRITRTIELG
jgi:ATPase subunit of ABC transporter with duplicated ATPase domains